MTSSVHYSWQADDGGQTFRRFAHGIEASNAFNSKYDGLWSMYTSITMSTHIPQHLLFTKLSTAWIRLRYEAPIIATKVEEASSFGEQYNEFVYEVQDPDGIENWMRQTMHVLPPMSKDEMHTSVMKDRSRLAHGRYTGNLYISPSLDAADTYRLVFATPHATTDVRGSISVLHRQLQLSSSDDEGIAANLKWGEEVQRLCPPLVYAAGLRKDGDEAPQDLQKMLADMNASQEAFTPSAVLRHKHNVEPYGPSHLPIMTSLVLEKPHHDKVIQAGRENGTSITGVVAGIMAMLSVRYSEEQSARSVSIWGVATDRRARLPEEYKPFYSQAIWSKSILLGNMEAIQSALQSVFGTGSINDEFWTVCRDFKADLDAFAKDDLSLAMSNDLVMAGLTAKGGIFENIPPAHIFYSSYGKYDTLLQHSYGSGTDEIKVDDPHCMALCHNLPVVALSSSSWKGRLTIFSQHSRNYYEEDAVKAFYADMQTCFDAVAASLA